MKSPFPIDTLALVLFAASAQSLSSPYHVDVKCELKRLEVKRSASQSTETAEEKWGHAVEISNHSFKEIPDLRAEYIIFSKHEKFGSLDQAKLERQQGAKRSARCRTPGK